VRKLATVSGALVSSSSRVISQREVERSRVFIGVVKLNYKGKLYAPNYLRKN
jgi:hypothetical protein